MLDTTHEPCKDGNMDTTGKALVDHWNWAAEKGLMNRNTASALRSACAQVIGVMDGWETVDVTTIDPQEVTRRFKNLRARNFAPKSLDAYEKRFMSALTSFLAYVRDPGAWKPVSQERATRAERKNSASKSNETAGQIDPPAHPASHSPVTSRDDVVDYQFPLRKNLSARLILPRDLKEAEVKRLQAYLALLVMTPEPDEEPGNAE